VTSRAGKRAPATHNVSSRARSADGKHALPWLRVSPGTPHTRTQGLDALRKLTLTVQERRKEAARGRDSSPPRRVSVRGRPRQVSSGYHRALRTLFTPHAHSITRRGCREDPVRGSALLPPSDKARSFPPNPRCACSHPTDASAPQPPAAAAAWRCASKTPTAAVAPPSARAPLPLRRLWSRRSWCAPSRASCSETRSPPLRATPTSAWPFCKRGLRAKARRATR
jgi:hypothetical protein